MERTENGNGNQDSDLGSVEKALITVVSIHVSEAVVSSQLVRARLEDFISHAKMTTGHYNGAIHNCSDNEWVAIFGLGEFADKSPINACGYAREVLIASDPSEFLVRIGVNTGEAFIDADCGVDWLDQQTNKTILHAKMMRDLSDPGNITISERTRYFIQYDYNLDQTKHSDIFTLKDQSLDPVVRFQNFIGRYVEINRIEGMYQRSINQEKQICLIIGSAGIGKTSIVREFLNTKYDVHIIKFSFSSAQNDEAGFLESIFQQFLTKLTNEIFGEDLCAGSHYLLSALDELKGIHAQDFAWVSLKAREKSHYKITIIERMAALISKRGKIIFSFEDVHWKTGAFFNFLDRLYKSDRVINSFFLLTSRKSQDFENNLPVNRIKLDALDPESSLLLLQSWLGFGAHADAIAKEILKKCSGNPFYLIEYIRGLVVSGVIEGRVGNYKLVGDISDLKIPETVGIAIASQLKSLPGKYRDFLRKASVLGSSFNIEDIKSIFNLDEDLRPIVSLLQNSDYISLTNGVLRFRHELLRHYIHGSLSEEEKHILHGRALAYFKASSGKAIKKIRICAYHASEAQQHNLSFIYNYMDCVQAVESEDIDRALVGFERAIASYNLLDNREHQRNTIRYINLCFAYSKIMCIKGSHDLSNIIINKLDSHIDGVSTHFTEMRKRLISSKLYSLWIGGDMKVAKEYAKSTWSENFAQKGGSGYISAGVRCAGILSDAGDFYDSNRIYDDIIPAFSTDGRDKKHNLLFAAQPVTLVGMSKNFGEVGDFEKAKNYSDRALNLIENSTNIPSKAYVYAYGTSYLLVSGQYQVAAELYEKAYEICLDYELSVLKPYIFAEYGYLKVKLGDARDGLSLLESALSEIERQKLHCKQSYYYRLLVLAYLHIGQYDLAYEAALQGGQSAMRSGAQANFAWNIFLAEKALYHLKGTTPDLDEAYSIVQDLSLKPLQNLIDQFKRRNGL